MIQHIITESTQCDVFAAGTVVLLKGDSEALRGGVRRFIRALPRDAKACGLEFDANREVVASSPAKLADDLVLVEIQLDE